MRYIRKISKIASTGKYHALYRELKPCIRQEPGYKSGQRYVDDVCIACSAVTTRHITFWDEAT